MARTDSHFRLRLPPVERAFIEREAEKNMRSMTSEIVLSIRIRMEAATGEGLGNSAPAAALNPAGTANADQ